MKLEVLVATMHRENCDFLKDMQITSDAVVINQTDTMKQQVFYDGAKRITFLSFHETGLSKSRNRALEAASNEICLLADDDMIYTSDYEEKILKTHEQYPDADIIAFQVTRLGNTRLKEFRNKATVENWISCMKISSVEITFKRDSILNAGLKFNELFGAGAYFNVGEENIFLYDCLRKKLKILYVPIVIGAVSSDQSSWFNGYSEKYFQNMGAAYYEMSHTWYGILILQHIIRHYKLYKKDISFFSLFNAMWTGKSVCKRIEHILQGQAKNLIVGDFQNDNGPAIVNKYLQKYRGNTSCYCMATSKFKRVIELLGGIFYCEVIGFSGISEINKLGITLAKCLRKPTYYLMHGYVKKEDEINEENHKKLQCCEQFILRHIDYILCVSEKFSDYLKQEYPMYSYKIHFLNNGVEKLYASYFPIQSVREDFIISIGGGSKLKNNLIVCQAIEKLNQSRSQALKFIIIGEGGKYIEQIKRYEFVEYKSHLSHKDVLEVLSKARLYIQNSYFETFGLSIIEALQCGCNLLISKHVGVLSILKECSPMDIIENVEDINEIAHKISFNLEHNNNNRLSCALQTGDVTWEKRSQELGEFIAKIRYKGLMHYEPFYK